MGYKPGGLDPYGRMRVSESRRNRRISVANMPSGSQTNQTTSKVNAFEGDIAGAQKTAETAMQTASAANLNATTAITQAQSAATVASSAATTANDAKSIADKNDSRITGLDGRVTRLENQSITVSLPSTVSSFDTIGTDWAQAATMTIDVPSGFLLIGLHVDVDLRADVGADMARARINMDGSVTDPMPFAYGGSTSIYPGSLTGVRTVHMTTNAVTTVDDAFTISVDVMTDSKTVYTECDGNVRISCVAVWAYDSEVS